MTKIPQCRRDTSRPRFGVTCRECGKSWVHLDVALRFDAEGVPCVAPRLTCLECGTTQVFNTMHVRTESFGGKLR